MKCPNVKKCKGDLTIKTNEENGSRYYYCPHCGYSNIKKD
jgi:hypothetical protein